MRFQRLALLCAAAVAACDFPTSLPRYDTRWDVVAVRDSVATADLLPEHMRVGPEGFVIDSFSVTAEVRLGDVCELCTCFEGPIPPLEIAPHDWQVQLPPGVLEATLERGTARVVIHNEVGFDLLDDGEGGKGFMAVDLVDTRDQRVIDGLLLSRPFPPGDSIELHFDLSGLVLNRQLVARVRGSIPGTTCNVELTPESGFRTEVELRDVVASTVKVWVSDYALRMPARDFNLPSFVAERLRTGEARLDVEVRVESRLPSSVEIGVSAAGLAGDLFTARSALYTPILIPTGTPSAPQEVRRLYVVQLDPLRVADHLYLDTRNRFLDNRLMELHGGESVRYEVRLRAEVPSR